MRPPMTHMLPGLAAAAAWFAAPGALAAPITFNTALPVSKDEVLFRQQVIVAHAENGAGAEETQVQAVSMLGYGVTGDVAVFAALPIVSRRVELGGVTQTDTGVGDATLFVRREIMRNDAPGRTLRLAGFTGLTLPTGDQGTGDGSVDAFAGLVLTAARTAWSADAQVQYVANTKADGFERGDAASLDISAQRRLSPAGSSPGYLYAVLEANATWMDKDRVAGSPNPDSGGVVAFLSPGLQFAARRWIAEAAVRVPVVRNLNGAALEPDYALVAGVRVNF